MSEKTYESRHNLEIIMGHLKFKPYDFRKNHKLFSYAFDWKFAAMFFGRGPASRYYLKTYLEI